MSRTFATPLRSLSRAVSRPGPTSARTFQRAPIGSLRLYSSEETASSAEGEKSGSESDKKVTELEVKIKDLEKDILYHKAEIQTLNRRIGDERAKATEFGITSFARSLLSTSDVLTTALSLVPKPIDPSNTALQSLFNGVELTQKAMLKTFQENGVVKMDVGRGTAFDPNLHEATFQIPKEVAGPKGDGGEWNAGEVVEVGKEGWMIGNRVLRPAQVGVTQIE